MGKENDANEAAGRAADAQTRLAQQLVGESAPLRQGLISDANAFVSGGRDVTGLPQYAALKSGVEGQYGRARDSIIANTPNGGGLSSALTDLELGRADTLVQGESAIAGDEINRALQLATFGTAQGSSGMNAAAMTQAQRAAAESQANSGKSQGLGSAGGSLAAWALSK